MRGGGVGRIGGAVRETIWGTSQFGIGIIVGSGGIWGICGGYTGMGVSGGGAVHCVVGGGGAIDAVADVAAGGTVLAGEIAGGDQFIAGVDGDGGAVAVYAGVLCRDFADGASAYGGGAVLLGDGVVDGECGVGVGGDEGKGSCKWSVLSFQ